MQKLMLCLALVLAPSLFASKSSKTGAESFRLTGSLESLADESPQNRIITFPWHHPAALTEQEWKNLYPSLRALGRGTHGRVFAKNSSTAIKVTQFDLGNANSVATLREALVLSQLKHPNVMEVGDSKFVRRGDQIFFQMEMPLYESFEEGKISHWDAKEYLYDIASALAYIHERDMAHQDVKPANTMRDPRTGLYKLGDFGTVGIHVSQEKDFSKTLSYEKTTGWYRSFEKVCGDLRWTKEGDIWALAVTYLHAFRPHKNKKFFSIPAKASADGVDNALLGAIREAVIRGWIGKSAWLIGLENPWERVGIGQTTIEEVYENLEFEETQLLDAMFNLNPTERITAKEILAHPFLAEVAAKRQVQAALKAAAGTSDLFLQLEDVASLKKKPRSKLSCCFSYLSCSGLSSVKVSRPSMVVSVFNQDRAAIWETISEWMIPMGTAQYLSLWQRKVDIVTDLTIANLSAPGIRGDLVLAVFYALILNYEWNYAQGDQDFPSINLLLDLEAQKSSDHMASLDVILGRMIEKYPATKVVL